MNYAYVVYNSALYATTCYYAMHVFGLSSSLFLYIFIISVYRYRFCSLALDIAYCTQADRPKAVYEDFSTSQQTTAFVNPQTHISKLYSAKRARGERERKGENRERERVKDTCD